MVKRAGEIAWIDLTVEKGRSVADFYQAVMGWNLTTVDVDDYQDFCVGLPESDEPIAGICHKRGANQAMPSEWMMYVVVEDLEQSMHHCEEQGGQVIVRNRDLGSYGRMSVIRDPAGAHCAIMQPPGD